MGYDTVYSRQMHDKDVLSIAIREGRAIVTRDLGLHRKALKMNLVSVYVPPDVTDVADMLVLVANELGLNVRFDRNNTRCPICNNRLSIVPKAQVATIVPPEVLNKYDTFWYCAKCHKAYWQGHHWRTIHDTLELVRSKLNMKPTESSGQSL